MGKESKREVSFEASLDNDEAIEYLQAVLNGMKSGTLCVQQGSREVTVHPGREVELAVKVKAKDDREGVSIELEWKPGAAAHLSKDFRILDREPNGVSGGVTTEQQA